MTRADREAMADMAATLADVLRHAPQPFPGWPGLFRAAVLHLSQTMTLAESPSTRYHRANLQRGDP